MHVDTSRAGVGRRGLVLTGAGLLAAATTPAPASAASAVAPGTVPARIGAGIEARLIGRWDADRLNRILSVDAPKFFGVAARFAPARNAVKLYRLTYPSVIPELGNTPFQASGLLAIPDMASSGTAASGGLDLLSYQHGTVYGRQEVPSFPENSPETQLVLAQFAGQGYAVIGADYLGMGTSDRPEGYLVKASHQQATQDMLRASRAVLAGMGIAPGKLFLCGWSQGGFVTMAFLERLESQGETAHAVATASAPVDGFVALSGFLDFPRAIDADWVTTLFILTAFSFEHYYGQPGLARALFNPQHYDVARRLYERQKLTPAEVPTRVRDLVRAEYFDPLFFAGSAYGRLVREHLHAYRWVVRSPVRNYYGEADEAIAVGLGRLAMTYQQAIGAGNDKVVAISTGRTNHRGTFMTAVPHWKQWFDGA